MVSVELPAHISNVVIRRDKSASSLDSCHFINVIVVLLLLLLLNVVTVLLMFFMLLLIQLLQ